MSLTQIHRAYMYTDKSKQYKYTKQNKTTFDCTHFGR